MNKKYYQWKKILAFILITAIFAETSLTSALASEMPPGAASAAGSRTEAEETAVPETETEETEDAVIIGEMEEMRGESAKQFLMSDGTCSMVGYDTDVHYQDADGSWQEIDNTLSSEAAADPSDIPGYANKKGRVRFKFAKNANANYLVKIRQGKYKLFFSLKDGQTRDAGRPSAAARVLTGTAPQERGGTSVVRQFEADHVRSGVIYENILSGTDLEYITSGSSLKENIIVREKQEDYQYTFEIRADKTDVIREDGGGIVFKAQDSGEVLYRIPAMYMVDADGRESDQVSVQLSGQDRKHVLVITADKEWMDAEERAYPVTIDPTLEASSSSTGSDTRIVQNQYVASGHPAMSGAGYGRGYLGYDGGAGDKIYRMFVQFKKLPVLPEGSVIAGAKFYYAQAYYDHVGMPELVIAAHKVTGGWSWGSRLTWNNQPACSGTVLDYQILSDKTTGQYVGWDITPLIKAHYESKDNASDDTSSFVLRGTEEGGYTAVHAAKADVIQENNAGYFTGAQPVLVIAYRNTRGLEGYHTCQTQDLGKAGMAYVGDYTKELTVVRPDVAAASAVMPFTISHIYNSAFGDKYFSNSTDLHTKDFSRMKTGTGWKLNIQETIVETTIGGKKYLIYNDSDGTEHYFSLKSGSKTVYEDEDGLKLEITKDGDRYTMKDEKDHVKLFDNGYLSTIRDANGNAVHLLYNGAAYSTSGGWHAVKGSSENQVTKVIRINSNSTLQMTVAELAYTNGLLTAITDAAGRVHTYQYAAAEAGKTSNLVKITDPDGTYARYDYYRTAQHGINRLARTLDSETGLGVQYGYHHTNCSARVSSFSEIVWQSETCTAGRRVEIGASGHAQTVYRDLGPDCEKDTEDDILTYCTFDSAGRTICENSQNRTGSLDYGSSGTAYQDPSSATSRQKNRIASDAAVGRNGINLLRNNSGESGEGTAADNWTTMKKTTTEDRMTLSVNSLGFVRTGNRSFSMYLHQDAQPADNGELMGVYTARASLEAGKTYTFSGYFKNTNAGAFNSRSRAYLTVSNNSNGDVAATGSVIDQATSADIENGWSRLSVTYRPETSGVYAFSARVNAIYGMSSFDDFQLEEGETPSSFNLIANGSAEWNEGWSFSGGAYSDSGFYGSRSLVLNGSPKSERSASVTVPVNVSSENTFVLSGWGRADSVADLNRKEASGRTFGLEAVLTYGDDSTEKHYISFDEHCTAKQFVSMNVVPKKTDQTVKNIRVRCVYGKNANTAWFDNISLKLEPVSCYQYDSDGNLTAANAAGQDQLNFQYSAGNLIRETDPSSGTYNYTYDDQHHLTAAVNDGVKMAVTYDGAGHVKTTEVSNPDSALSYKKSIKTDAAYHTNGTGDHLSSQTDAAGAVTRYNTNAIGLTNIVTDALGHRIRYWYDNNSGRMTKAALDDDTAVNYTYSKGAVSGIVRDSLLPDGGTWEHQTYSFTYDTYGNVTAVRAGNKTLAAYSYMAKNGPLTKVVYPDGYAIEYGHDALGRVITEKRDGVLRYRYIYGSEGGLSRKEELDGSGRVMKADCYEYDGLDRLIRSWEENLINGRLVRGVSTEHLYDTSNRLTGQGWQLSDGSSRSESYTYSSKDGTMSSITTASGETVSLTYDYLKRPAKRSDGKLTMVYGYTDVSDTRTTSQVNKLRYEGISGDILLNYVYDALDNITEVKRDGEIIAAYTYDAQSQLIHEELPKTGLQYDYSYDTAGNIRSMTTVKDGTAATRTFDYQNPDLLDAVSAIDGHPLVYDANNNPEHYYNGREWDFTWQDGRQLAEAVSGDTHVSYTYDANGLRKSKTYNDTDYTYSYLGSQLVQMKWDTETLDFAYDEQGRPYSMTHNGEKTYYYVLNLQGDVIAMVDGEGDQAAGYTYNAWGRIIEETDSPIARMNPLRYRGYVYDAETEMYYLNSRYYDPGNCRFINADDVSVLNASPASLNDKNLFAYCDNNPVMRADLDGTLWHMVIGATLGGVISGGLELLSQVKAGGSYDISKILIATASGAVGGLCAATSLKVGSQIAINAGIGVGSYLVDSVVHDEPITLGGVISSGLAGAASGAIGGHGANGKILQNNWKVANKTIAKEVRRNSYKYSEKRIAQQIVVKAGIKKTTGIATARFAVGTGVSRAISNIGKNINKWWNNLWK